MEAEGAMPMQATPAEIDALLRLQQIDLDILHQEKQLESLPQRKAIVTARSKREALASKYDQIRTLEKDAKRKLMRIDDEDASLLKKERGVQAAIDAGQGDYRNVEARSKELAGIEKRRHVIGEDRKNVQAEADKIGTMKAQVELAMEELEAEEQKATTSFREIGGMLQNEIANLKRERGALAETIDSGLLETYTKIAARTGGVAVGELDGSRCGVCHAPIEGGRLIDLKAHAPIGSCPSCKRLLIIQE